MSIVLLIMGLLLFVGLVVIHEFGHFIVARRNGVEVEEFGIGFPPRAWSKKTKSGFIFSLNWLPIGGFVKLKGETDADKRPGSMGAASTKVKAKIMLAGVVMNLLVAFGLLTILGWLGMPQILDGQYRTADAATIKHEVLAGYIEEGSPAAKAGLKVGDQLRTIGPENTKASPLKDAKDLPGITKKYAGQTVIITYERDDQTKTAKVTLRTAKEAKGAGFLGISPTDYELTRAGWGAPVQAVGLMKQFTVLTFEGLGRAVSALFQGDPGRASQEVSGPVGVFAILKEGSILGYQFVLIIIALVSLTLALMNVLPIPALDGGRLFVILLSRLFGKTLSEEMEERIVGTSFLFLMFLIIIITIVDVKRFF